MSFSAGFLINAAEVTAVTAAYQLAKKVRLTASAVDARAALMPSACHLSHLELQLDETAAAVANVSGYLTWDAAGDDPMAIRFNAVPVDAGLTDTSLRVAVAMIDKWVARPSGATAAGECYLHIKGNAGEFTVKKARLVWTDRR